MFFECHAGQCPQLPRFEQAAVKLRINLHYILPPRSNIVLYMHDKPRPRVINGLIPWFTIEVNNLAKYPSLRWVSTFIGSNNVRMADTNLRCSDNEKSVGYVQAPCVSRLSNTCYNEISLTHDKDLWIPSMWNSSHPLAGYASEDQY